MWSIEDIWRERASQEVVPTLDCLFKRTLRTGGTQGVLFPKRAETFRQHVTAASNM